MSAALTSVVLRDKQDDPMGHVRYTPHSGWLWACSQCPAANRPGAGALSPEEAVEYLVGHIGRAHP